MSFILSSTQTGFAPKPPNRENIRFAVNLLCQDRKIFADFIYIIHFQTLSIAKRRIYLYIYPDGGRCNLILLLFQPLKPTANRFGSNPAKDIFKVSVNQQLLGFVTADTARLHIKSCSSSSSPLAAPCEHLTSSAKSQVPA